VIGDHAVRRVLDSVQHVVETHRESLNVFRIKRRDKSLIQTSEDIVGDLVTPRLDSLDLFPGRGKL
jgi:hypothetical protein